MFALIKKAETLFRAAGNQKHEEREYMIKMKWYEVRVSAKREAYDAISDMIMSIGANGVVIDDPKGILEEITGVDVPDYFYDYIEEDILNKTYNNEMVTIKGYFPETKNVDELIKLISDKISGISEYIETGKVKIEYSELYEDDWANNWKAYYKPFNITDNVIIKPTWEDYSTSNSSILIEMDPGMAFGTGTHETTRMCARLLEKFIESEDNVIDVGSGSGILSIISAKLGAKNIIAMDIDEDAVNATKNNCRINNVCNKVKVFEGTLDSFSNVEKYFNYEKADVVVANIIADVIINLCEAVRLYVKRKGLFIASGIIKDKKDSVLSKYFENGFQCKQIVEDGEWVAIVFICPGSL